MSPLEVIAAGPYNLFYTLAIAAAAGSMFVAGQRRGWSSQGWALAVAAWVVAGMVGAMLPRVLFGDAIAYRTAVGAVIFATLALGLIARALRRDTAQVFDTTAVAIPLGAAIVRVGCFLAECCQGVATSLPIGVALHPDDVARHPVQLYESTLEAALAMVVARQTTWRRPGRQFATSLFGMCAIRFATEFVRDNDKFGGLSLAQWIVLPTGVLCLILCLSRPRAAKPKRVLTARARRATIGVVGGLAIAALLAELPALESTVLLLGAACLLLVLIRKLGRVAPSGLAVLVLQMPAVRPDSTFPRTSTFFGAGASLGAWDYMHQYTTCDGTVHEEWSRRHSSMSAAFEMGARTEHSATRFFTIRAKGLAGTEQIGRAEVFQGTPPDPQAYSRQTYGISLVGDADWKYLGLSLGATVGQLYPALELGSDNPNATDHPAALTAVPAFGLRIGPRRGLSGEFRIADESPLWIPAPAISASMAFGDSSGNRLRVGVTEVGYLIAGRVITVKGLEVMPSVIIPGGGESEVRNGVYGGVMFRKWITGGHPRQGGR